METQVGLCTLRRRTCRSSPGLNRNTVIEISLVGQDFKDLHLQSNTKTFVRTTTAYFCLEGAIAALFGSVRGVLLQHSMCVANNKLTLIHLALPGYCVSSSGSILEGRERESGVVLPIRFHLFFWGDESNQITYLTPQQNLALSQRERETEMEENREVLNVSFVFSLATITSTAAI